MWSALELRHVDLGDRRLNRRLVKLVDDFSMPRRPASLRPPATGPPPRPPIASGTTPASTPMTSAAHSPQSPWNGSRPSRTSRSWPSRTPPASTSPPIPPTTGLGYLGHRKRSGLWLHSVLAVTAAGVPLGLLDQRTWARDPATLGKRARRNQKETADEGESALARRPGRHRGRPARRAGGHHGGRPRGRLLRPLRRARGGPARTC